MSKSDYTVVNKELKFCNNAGRNYGIDLLRIVSMTLIVVLHVLGHGKLLTSVEECSSKYYILWSLETMAYCAVNCFGLISGYVGYGQKFKLSNLFNLWIEVIFYNVTIAILFKVFNSNIGLKKIVPSLFPLTLNAYWYFSAYFIMFFFTPFFQYLIDRLSKRKATILVGCIVLLASIMQLFVKEDFFSLNSGYTALWLAFLYIFGAYIKKYNYLFTAKKAVLCLIYIICIIISFGYKYILEMTGISLPKPIEHFAESNLLIQYNSPTILLCGIVLLLFFSKMQFNKVTIKFISIFSPAAFGVYLIHDNSMVEEYVMPRIEGFKDLNVILLPCVVIGLILSIWFICSLIDIVRFKLFELIRVKMLSIWLEKKARIVVDTFVNKIIA